MSAIVTQRHRAPLSLWLFATTALSPLPALAQSTETTLLPEIEVTGQAPKSRDPLSTPPIVQRFQLPVKAFSTTAKQIEDTVNVKDAEDAVKYMPSLFVRKRNDGDNSSVLATRTWGLNSSARTLIYSDDLLISALIGNNNNGASPHWNLVPPDTIERIDFLNGPYSAAYPGNSMGGVLLITTSMPDHLVATAKQTFSVQNYSVYGTKNTYATKETALSVGDRIGAFSWLLSTNIQVSDAQPLTFVTASAPPAGTTGTFLALNKQGIVADVVGVGAQIHSEQIAANLKLAYDVTPAIRATYTLGVWNNRQTSSPQTYLTSNATGLPTFAGISGFASGQYNWTQTHVSNAISVRSDTRGIFDFDLSASTYNYLTDIQKSPYTVVASPGLGFSQNGKIVRNDGTNWQNVDAKGIWRPQGIDGAHEVSFGIHGDRYYFNNPTYASSIWNATSSIGTNQLYSEGQGQTQTAAFWAQDAWKFAPGFKLTLGGRLESWRASDGVNINTVATSVGVISSTTAMSMPTLSSTNFSPKLSLSWDVNKDWNVTGSFGEAYRYPTVTELYQNISVNGLATFANPFLKPEQDLNGEVNIERKWDDGRVRLTLFHEHTNDAIISQTNLATNPVTFAQVPTTTIGNVNAIRMQGVELSAEKDNVFIEGLQFFGSLTYVDSRILSDPGWVGTLNGVSTTAVGKRVPYVPDWRAKAGFTYRPTKDWAWTVAARYSGKQYSTMDNTDIIPHVYGAFDNYFVVDTHLHYTATERVSFDVGVDNLTNTNYWLFHPFPGRTYVADVKIKF
jgi:iron complex outermembrane receptor protein